MSHKRHRGWRSTRPSCADVGPLLRQSGFRGSEADPIDAKASFDAADRPRRIHARYANGWTCTVHFALDGSYSLSQSLRLRVCAGAQA